MRELKQGFYTALGTPLDAAGNIVADSLTRQIEMQIDAGASGYLLMGSMGMEASIRDDAYVDAVRIAAEANRGRLPLFVGAMDNSIARVKDRIDRIRDCAIDAIVLTTPFYFVTPENTLLRFFTEIAAYSPFPVFLYDLPGVTKQKITFSMVEKLPAQGNIGGIKTGDIVLARQIKQAGLDIQVLYSNLDCFDVAIAYGIDKVLDGMFAACPKNGAALTGAIAAGDIAGCAKAVDAIVYLRDVYAAYGIFPSFTVSMNQLGMAGSFSPDYMLPLDPALEEKITDAMKKIGELA